MSGCSAIIIMSDILPNLGLANRFASRIRQFLLILELSGNVEILCEVADYLTVSELIRFLSTSSHMYSLKKIPNIQIRILRAKLDYYERPKIQPNFDTYINFMQIKVPSETTTVRSQKLAEDHKRLKQFNKEMRMYNQLKREGIVDNKKAFQKLADQKQIKESIKTKFTVGEIGKNQKHKQNQDIVSSQYRNKGETLPNSRIQLRQIKSVQGKPGLQYNPYILRLEELEYKQARQDYERRKLKRNQQQQSLLTLDELKEMAKVDPCSRQIFNRVYQEQMQRVQRENISRLKMKPIKVDAEKLQRLRLSQEQDIKNIVVKRQSIAGRFFSNLKEMIWQR